MAFVPIGIDDYVALHVKANPTDNQAEIAARLLDCVEAAKSGVRCDCGEPIWVIGSAIVGSACFMCITGEAWPAEDYEIDEALRLQDRIAIIDQE